MFKVAILQKRSINEQIDKNIETIIMAMEEASETEIVLQIILFIIIMTVIRKKMLILGFRKDLRFCFHF